MIVLRQAALPDIPQIQGVRNSVKENTLSDPLLVTDADCEEYLFKRGKGWVAEQEGGMIIGFAIVDLVDHNLWALFVHPDFEKKGVGKKLHDVLLDWYFVHTTENIWLGTGSGTRAEKFYRKAGWIEVGLHGKGEIKFEMSSASWRLLKN